MLGALLLLMSVITPSGQPAPKQPSDYTPAGQPNVVSWQLKRLPPPSALYVTADDFLVASAASSLGNEVVTINIRRLDASDARPHLEQLVVRPGSNRAVVTKTKPLAEGFILSISCQAFVAFSRGQTFLRLGLGNSALGAGQPAQMLLADYVTTAMAPGHPNGRVLSPNEGPGWVHGVSPSAPAAGADLSIVVPVNARWRIQALRAQLTTSAAAGNRAVSILLTAGAAGNPYQAQGNFNQPPSTVDTYAAGAGAAVAPPAAAVISLPMPDNLILNGTEVDVIGTFTSGMQAGDQWANPSLLIEEWLDNV